VQVWDSGIGIADSALPRIFDEFYQVQSNRPLEAHHRKGLGLGLAIVKRLAALMDAPLTCARARPRHGVLAAGAAGQGAAQHGRARQQAPRRPLGLTLEGPPDPGGGRRSRRARRPGGAAAGLGRGVVAFDTVAVEALQAWLAGSPPAEPRPGCWWTTGCRRPHRHRRPGGPARALAGAALPAIMITGSSLGGHEDEAVTTTTTC
jgi:hypothetical protein